MKKELRIIGTVFAYIPPLVLFWLGIQAIELFDRIRYKADRTIRPRQLAKRIKKTGETIKRM